MHAWIKEIRKNCPQERGSLCCLEFFWFGKSLTWTRHLFNTNVVKLKLLPVGSTSDCVNCDFKHPASVVVARLKKYYKLKNRSPFHGRKMNNKPMIFRFDDSVCCFYFF